ncbi:MAG: hypothetical protein ACRDK0_05345, partial [Solirubrobacteraceae bacterium]
MTGSKLEHPFREHGVEKSLTITAPTPGGELASRAPGELQGNAYDSSDEVRRVRYRLPDGNVGPRADRRRRRGRVRPE